MRKLIKQNIVVYYINLIINMIKYITSILSSKNANSQIYRWLVGIALIYATVAISNKSNANFIKNEGFHQTKPYVYKKDDDIYDEFYAHIYDELTNTSVRSEWELVQMVRLTSPDTNHSVFLDIGSGTGYTVNELTKTGYKAYGVDKSPKMIEYAEKKYPNIQFVTANVEDSMTFERASFTHILCTKMTIYQFKDKHLFFSNCFRWMIPNGYLILHLVDRNYFNIIKPNANRDIKFVPLILDEPDRCTKVLSHYDDFKYKACYSFPENLEEMNVVSLTETFVDKETNYVRNQEHTMYMEDMKEIIKIAKQVGFIFHAKVDMENVINDENQYLYVLERPQ